MATAERARGKGLLWAALLAGAALPAAAQEAPPAQLNFYGVSGLIDMPSARSQPDGQLALTSSYFGPTLRNTLSFQITPRLSGSFRYARIEDFDFNNTDDRFDRSFDLSFRFLDEGRYVPAMAFGLQDFGGTGLFGAEYFVATKSFGPVSATAGIGWGRLGSRGGFDNPLGVFSDKFDTRPNSFAARPQGGQASLDSFFRGPAALFGGLEWQVNDRLRLLAEYSSDAYAAEEGRGLLDAGSPFSFGASYQFANGVDLGAYYLYGSEIGAALSYRFDTRGRRSLNGIEEAPPPVIPRDAGVAASWGTDWAAQPQVRGKLTAALSEALAAQGLTLVALRLTPDAAVLHLDNGRFDAETQALGRAARVAARLLPVSVERITLVPMRAGVPTTAVTLARADIERFENAFGGSEAILAAARIEDAAALAPARADLLEGRFPRFGYDLGPYLRTSFFDPDSPVRADVGAQLELEYLPAPGLRFSTDLRLPLAGNLDGVTRRSNSVLPRVRTDRPLYDINTDFEVARLTGEYIFRPGPDLYGRVSAGYLERMFGGVSAEVLWKPVEGPLALGAEVNYARKRDYDGLLGFQDYDIVTGHASAYYDFGGGYHGQIDAGRYLAGDWGATFSLDRNFDNGWSVGAFATFTDVSAADFGEGSFDKGIRITVPLSTVTNKPTRATYKTTLRPTLRDGGARLDVENRLYPLTEDLRSGELADSWGRFWR